MSTSLDDHELLRRFAASQDEAAFTELVRRHIRHVYAAAWREVREAHLAADLTQAAFILLARRAQDIRSRQPLSGWLFQTVRYAARNARRAAARRKHYEEEAAAMIPTSSELEGESLGDQVAPLLNDALASLAAGDRDVVTLRFFEDKSHEEIGICLGVPAAVARKRLSRAVERLRLFLERRGVAVTGASLLAVLGTCHASAAPAGLADAVVAGAVAKGASASGPVAALVKAGLEAVIWAKVKTVAGLGGLAAIILGGLAYQLADASDGPGGRLALDEIRFTNRFQDRIQGDQVVTADGRPHLFVRTTRRRAGFAALGRLWRPAAGANPVTPAVILEVADDRGDSIQGAFLKWASVTSRVQHDLWQVPFFPRRGSNLWLRLLDRDLRPLAEWQVPNPASAAHAAFLPEALPSLGVDGDLSVRLEDFVSSPLPAGGYPRRQTTLTYSIRQEDRASRSWALRSIQAEDGTGNHLRETRPAVEALGAAEARFQARFYWALWAGEPAWRVGLEFMRTNDFDAAHLLALPPLPVPAADSEVRLNQSYEWHGLRVRLLALSGPQRGSGTDAAQPPGHVVLQAEARGAGSDWRLGVVEAKDDQDRDWRVTDDQRQGARLTFRLHGPPGAKALALKLAWQEIRRVTFTARLTDTAAATGDHAR